MKLKEFDRHQIQMLLRKNGTSEKKIRKFIRLSNTEVDRIEVGYNNKFTFVVVNCGETRYVGISSRCRYEPQKDEFNLATGVSIALFRALKEMV